jgi:hypothetical protein
MSFGQHAVEYANNLADAFHGPWARETPNENDRLLKLREAFFAMLRRRITTRPDESPEALASWTDLVHCTLIARGVPIANVDVKALINSLALAQRRAKKNTKGIP